MAVHLFLLSLKMKIFVWGIPVLMYLSVGLLVAGFVFIATLKRGSY